MNVAKVPELGALVKSSLLKLELGDALFKSPLFVKLEAVKELDEAEVPGTGKLVKSSLPSSILVCLMKGVSKS